MAIDPENDLNKDIELKKLGETIKRIRQQKGVSQSELANRINKDQQSIQRLEKGKINASYFYLLEVAKGLDIHIRDIIA